MPSIQEAASAELARAIAASGGLLGKKEIGVLLGVTRQRAGQLVELEDFPQPIAEVSGIPVWLGLDIESWQRRRAERLKKRRQRGTRPDRHATLRGSRA